MHKYKTDKNNKSSGNIYQIIPSYNDLKKMFGAIESNTLIKQKYFCNDCSQCRGVNTKEIWEKYDDAN